MKEPFFECASNMTDELRLFIFIGLVVLLILLLLLIGFVFFLIREDKGISYISFVFSLNPKTGLSYQYLFWMSILLPVSLFFITGYFAWYGCDLKISSSGFNNFIYISKLPLSILALCLPLSILVSRLHGTEQTALQIRLTKVKNNIDLYISHQKHFSESIDHLANELNSLTFNKFKSAISIDSRALYNHVFSDSSFEDGYKPIPISIIVIYKSHISLFYNLMKEIIDCEDESRFDSLVKWLVNNFHDMSFDFMITSQPDIVFDSMLTKHGHLLFRDEESFSTLVFFYDRILSKVFGSKIYNENFRDVMEELTAMKPFENRYFQSRFYSKEVVRKVTPQIHY